MNDQLQKVLADIIAKVTSGADAVVEFSKQQLPEVLQQLLMWHFISNLLSFIIPLVLLTICLTVSVRFWVKVPKQDSRDKDDRCPWIADEYRDKAHMLYFKYWLPGYALPAASFILGIITLCNSNLVWLKIALAPKLYLLEYAASLIKSTT